MTKEAIIAVDRKENSRTKPPSPRKHGQAIEWEFVAREYIFGIVTEGKNGDFERVYPTFREMAQTFGINASTLGTYAKKHQWTARRDKFKIHLREEFEQEIAKARALSSGDTLGIIDTYIRRFDAAVKADAVNRHTIKDFDTAVRIRAFIQKEVDRSQDATETLNLGQLQAKHATQREFAQELDTSEVGFIASRTDREEKAGLFQPKQTQVDPVKEGDEEAASIFEGAASPVNAKLAVEETPSDKPRRVKRRQPKLAGDGWPAAQVASKAWQAATAALSEHMSEREFAALKAYGTQAPGPALIG